ncbi:MAG: RDD family protein [Moheibacter sp.]
MNPTIQFLPNKTLKVDDGLNIVTYRYASFGDRFLARFLDVLIMFIPSSFLPFIGPWLYWSFMQSSPDQATVGQKAMSIKLISDNGRQVSFGQATGRFFADWLNLLTFFIGYFLFFFDSHNQCLHDKLAGVYVVKEIGRSANIDLIGRN